METRKELIINKLGLHARAAAKLAELADQFDSDIYLEKSGQKIDAKSIMQVMMLAATKDSEILISADGSDEKPAIDAIAALIKNRFDEEE